jgi:hypothetical protein
MMAPARAVPSVHPSGQEPDSTNDLTVTGMGQPYQNSARNRG